MNTYFILGHGSEEPLKYTSRAKVPKGITLVIPTQPYGSITSANIIEFLKLNKTKKYMLKNPKKYKKGIEANLINFDKTTETLNLRFYNEGDLMPNMTIKLISDFLSETQNGKIVGIYSKSGVYQDTVPDLNPADYEKQSELYDNLKYKNVLFTGNGLEPLPFEELHKYYAFSATSLNPKYLNEKLYEQIYNGAVFTPDDIDQYVLENNIDTDDTLSIKLSELLKIMEKKGMKGTVYCLTCRGNLLIEFNMFLLPILKFIIDYNGKTNKDLYTLYVKAKKTNQPIPESIPPNILNVFQLFHEIIDNTELLQNLNNLPKEEKVEVLDKFNRILNIIYATRHEMDNIRKLIKQINDYKAYTTDTQGYEKSHSNEVQKKKQERYEKKHPNSSSPAASQSSKGLKQLFRTTSTLP